MDTEQFNPGHGNQLNAFTWEVTGTLGNILNGAESE